MACNVHAYVFLYLILPVSRVALAVVPQAPCYFAFGDSLADPGNNNNLKTIAKANYPPYGVDFPGGANPSGRFSNGRTYVDFIAESLGFTAFLPPVAGAAVGNFIGVNYASGAAGILNDTGKTSGDRISLAKQLLVHQKIVDELPTILKTNKQDVTNLLNKCVYTIGIGSNDYINNYFMPQSYDSSAKYAPSDFAKLLITEHNAMVKGLWFRDYTIWERERWPLLELDTLDSLLTSSFCNGPGAENATKLNDAVDLFNVELKASVDTLAKGLPEAKLTYLNTVGISSGGPQVPLEATRPCCQNIDSVNQVTCKNGDTAICPDRAKALFFDNIHPTEAVHQAISARYFASKDPSDAYPFDIQKLASLQVADSSENITMESTNEHSFIRTI